MRDRKPYWKDHPAYVEHWLLAKTDHKSGKWEMFCVDYRTDHIDYQGGKCVEFYWNGDFQETFAWSPVTNPAEMLDQFIESWLEDEYDWGSPPDQDVPGKVVG